MDLKLGHLAAAAALAGAIGFGGVSLASAQEDTTTTTPSTTEDDATNNDDSTNNESDDTREGCDHDQDSGESGTTDSPSAEGSSL